MDPIAVGAAIDVGKLAHPHVKREWNARVHGGYERIGSAILWQTGGRAWKIKVRWSGHRGHFLKLKPRGRSGSRLRASADQYKPDRYLPITMDEWRAFYWFVADTDSERGRTELVELHDRVLVVLNRLTEQRKGR